MTSLNLEKAKQAKEAVKVESEAIDLRESVQSRGQLREYSAKTGPTTEDNQSISESADATADPVRVNHGRRRDVRMAPASFDVTRSNFPKVFVECGCGNCPAIVDSLVVPSENPFEDVWADQLDSFWAQDVCPSPRAVPLEKAREAYLRFQKADHNHDKRTSLCEKTEVKHGKILGAERQLLEEGYGKDATVILFSFRISPIEINDGERYWVTPVELDNDLHRSWTNITGTLRYQFRNFEYEYVAITSTTTIAATPHTHMVVLVDDPDDEVTTEMARAVVQSHVSNCPRAHEEHHSVEENESDAANIRHTPPISTYPWRSDTANAISKEQDQFRFPNTQAMEYAANQRPHWVLKNVYDGQSNVHRNSVLVDGGAVAWARQHNWVKSSQGLDLQNGTFNG